MEMIDINYIRIKHIERLLHLASIKGWLSRCPHCNEMSYVKYYSIVTNEPYYNCFNPECKTFTPNRFNDAEPCKICGIPKYICYC